MNRLLPGQFASLARSGIRGVCDCGLVSVGWFNGPECERCRQLRHALWEWEEREERRRFLREHGLSYTGVNAQDIDYPTHREEKNAVHGDVVWHQRVTSYQRIA
jgi:hypothetical protein